MIGRWTPVARLRMKFPVNARRKGMDWPRGSVTIAFPSKPRTASSFEAEEWVRKFGFGDDEAKGDGGKAEETRR